MKVWAEMSKLSFGLKPPSEKNINYFFFFYANNSICFVLTFEQQKIIAMSRKRKRITKFEINPEDVRKANRKGSREAELEVNYGFAKGNTPHKSKKTYTRKKKHRE